MRSARPFAAPFWGKRKAIQGRDKSQDKGKRDFRCKILFANELYSLLPCCSPLTNAAQQVVFSLTSSPLLSLYDNVLFVCGSLVCTKPIGDCKKTHSKIHPIHVFSISLVAMPLPKGFYIMRWRIIAVRQDSRHARADPRLGSCQDRNRPGDQPALHARGIYQRNSL